MLTIDIVKLEPEIPSLPLEPSAQSIQKFGYQVEDALRAAGDQVVIEAGDPRWNDKRSMITATAKTVDLVSVTEESGVVHRRISVTVTGTSRHLGTDMGNRLKRAVEQDLVRKIAPWLGRIEQGSVVKIRTEDPTPANEVGRVRAEKYTLQADFELISQIIG